MKEVLYFISGHGFGHSVRSALVIGELHKLGYHSHIITSAPKYIFDINLKGIPFDYHKDISDVGVTQSSSLEINLPGTLKNWRGYIAQSEGWLEKSLELCRKIKPDAIVSDIVPLAFPLARRAGIPSFLIATFTWNWILDFYRDDDPAFGEIARQLLEYYMMADRLIYTPLSFGLPEFTNSHSVPMIGKRCKGKPEDIRKRFGLDDRPVFLVSFGGLGLKEMDRLKLGEMKNFQFLFLAEESKRIGNVITLSSEEADYEELVAISRAVITKPGYGISCETIINRVPMIYTSRGKFAEYEPLVEEINKYIPTRFISNEKLYGGGLGPYLEDPPEFSGEYLTDPGTGASEAAAHLLCK